MVEGWWLKDVEGSKMVKGKQYVKLKRRRRPPHLNVPKGWFLQGLRVAHVRALTER